MNMNSQYLIKPFRMDDEEEEEEPKEKEKRRGTYAVCAFALPYAGVNRIRFQGFDLRP